MKVLPANWKKWLIHYWAGRHPERLGHLWLPGGTITVYPHLSYALDNGKFAATVGFANAYGWQYAPKHRPLKWAVEHAGVQYPAKLLIRRDGQWSALAVPPVFWRSGLPQILERSGVLDCSPRPTPFGMTTGDRSLVGAIAARSDSKERNCNEYFADGEGLGT